MIEVCISRLSSFLPMLSISSIESGHGGPSGSSFGSPSLPIQTRNPESETSGASRLEARPAAVPLDLGEPPHDLGGAGEVGDPVDEVEGE